jgi:hypothetical protein
VMLETDVVSLFTDRLCHDKNIGMARWWHDPL